MQPPETRYARMGDVSIAYQVLGRGPDLILVPMFVGHLDLMWTEPGAARFLERAASFARVIVFDMPGIGLSDRVSGILTLDERVGEEHQAALHVGLPPRAERDQGISERR